MAVDKGAIGMSASEPHEQCAGFSPEPGQRVEGPLCEPICGLADHSELGLADHREGPGPDVLDSEKTRGTDQLKKKEIVSDSTQSSFLTTMSLPLNVSGHCVNSRQGVVSSLPFGSMRRDRSSSSN